MSFQVVSLLLVSLSFVLMEENGTRENTKILQRRYSEGTLASDYSRTLDNMLKKNFVDWLLTRREHKTDDGEMEESPLISQAPSVFEPKLPPLCCKASSWFKNGGCLIIRNTIDPSKREVESQTLNTSSHRPEAGFQDFLLCLLQQSLTLLKGSDQWKDIRKQEFLDWLISADLCRPMGQ